MPCKGFKKGLIKGCNACIARAGRLPVACYDPEVNPVPAKPAVKKISKDAFS